MLCTIVICSLGNAILTVLQDINVRLVLFHSHNSNPNAKRIVVHLTRTVDDINALNTLQPIRKRDTHRQC